MHVKGNCLGLPVSWKSISAYLDETFSHDFNACSLTLESKGGCRKVSKGSALHFFMSKITRKSNKTMRLVWINLQKSTKFRLFIHISCGQDTYDSFSKKYWFLDLNWITPKNILEYKSILLISLKILHRLNTKIKVNLNFN